MWNILLVKASNKQQTKMKTSTRLHWNGTNRAGSQRSDKQISRKNTLNARNQNQKNSKRRLMMGEGPPFCLSIAGVSTSFFIDLLMKHTGKWRRRESPIFASSHPLSLSLTLVSCTPKNTKKFINFIREGKRNNEWVSVEFSVKKYSRCAGAIWRFRHTN